MSKQVTLRSMTPNQVQGSMAKSGLVWVPEYQHPIIILAMIQQMFRQGMLYQVPQGTRDAIIHSAKRHFGDAAKFDHVAELHENFKYNVSEDRLDAGWSIINSMVKGLNSEFGYDGGFRMWCALWDTNTAGYQVQFSPTEPVAALVPVPDSPGLDEYAPHYDLWVRRAMEEHIDKDKAMLYLQYAPHLPETHDVRVSADSLMRVMFEAGDMSTQANGAPFTPLTGSLAAAILPRSPWLREAPVVNGVKIEAGDPRSSAWGDAVVKLIREVPAPVYPLQGYNVTQLAQLAPVQRHGAPRRGYTHSGLDLPGPVRTPVLSLWDGKVVSLQRGEAPRVRPDEATDSRGNYIILMHEHELDGLKYKVTTEYYHLDSVPDTITRGKQAVKLERDTKVNAGEVIGLLGSTGNSTGPHLHLDVRVGLASAMGRSERRWTLNPATVLEHGLIAAMREAGVTLGSQGAPHLAPAAIALEAISTGRGRLASGMPSMLLRQYQEMTAKFMDSLKEQAQAAASAAADVVQQVIPTAQKVGAAGFDAFSPGTPGRSALELAYNSVGLPGPLMGSVLDALHASFDAAAGTGPDKRAQALQGLGLKLGTLDLTDEQRDRALSLAGNLYNTINK